MMSDTSTLPQKLTAIEAKALLMEAYNEAYSIDAGVSGVEQSSLEHVSQGSLFSHYADQFVKLKIGDHFKISFFEYLQLPRDLIEQLNNVATVFNRDDTAGAQHVLNQLKNINT